VRKTTYGAVKNAADQWPERSAGALRACSACAGDYEDPERTAPPRQLDEAALADGQEADGAASAADGSDPA